MKNVMFPNVLSTGSANDDSDSFGRLQREPSTECKIIFSLRIVRLRQGANEKAITFLQPQNLW